MNLHENGVYTYDYIQKAPAERSSIYGNPILSLNWFFSGLINNASDGLHINGHYSQIYKDKFICDSTNPEICDQKFRQNPNSIITIPMTLIIENPVGLDLFEYKCEENCGDGILYKGALKPYVTTSHTCDDGNLSIGDGCDKNCQIETGFTCKRSFNGNYNNFEKWGKYFHDTDTCGYPTLGKFELQPSFENNEFKIIYNKSVKFDSENLRKSYNFFVEVSLDDLKINQQRILSEENQQANSTQLIIEDYEIYKINDQNFYLIFNFSQTFSDGILHIQQNQPNEKSGFIDENSQWVFRDSDD